MYVIPKTPKTIKTLIYLNAATYILYFVMLKLGIDLSTLFGIVPYLVLKKYYAWQFATYMFMHASVVHLLFNMLMLWMLGTELYKIWGRAFFLKYYFICGIGAGIAVVFLSLINTSSFMVPTIGSSGAIFGLLLAYGSIFKEKVLYVFGIFPVKALKLVIIMGVIEIFSLLSQENSSISHLAHLGGLLTGFLYLRSKTLQRKLAVKKYKKWSQEKGSNVIKADFDTNKEGDSNKTWN